MTGRSTISSSIESYLALKRALGRKFINEGYVFAALDEFLSKAGAADLTADSFGAWCVSMAHLSPTTRRCRMRVVRNLCLYRRRTVSDCFVPDADTFPAPCPPRRPYVFTHAEIAKLLEMVNALKPHTNCPLRAQSYRLAVVLLYTAGLRRGELCRLVLGDYDPQDHTLQIRSSKFHKSRIVALSSDASVEMEAFLRLRRLLSDHPEDPLLVRRWRGALHARSGGSLGQVLHGLFGKAGITTAAGSPPRVHDIRHTHAVHALLRWYEAGEDVQAKLPSLAASMGHVSIVSTAYYLSFIEPLAHAASERFARHCAAILRPEVGP